MGDEQDPGDGGVQPTIIPPRTDRARDAEPAAPAPPRFGKKLTFLPGQVVAERYRVVRFIAAGGMGEVYEVEDQHLQNEHVALKTVRPEFAEEHNALARFKREIQLARRVTHPNVCRIYEFGIHRSTSPDGEPLEVAFLTMELLSGESLTARIRRGGKMSPAEALPLIEQMAAALAAAHKAGIVHRDFKSANVMLLAEASGVRAVVTDFGLARHELSSDSLTGTGGIVGTPDYMAPEQVEGGAITAGTDIYALGVVMYELVTGRMPFTGESALSVAVKRLREPPEPLRPNAPDLDPQWEAVILRCLERDPAARFTSIDEVLRALRGEPATVVGAATVVPTPSAPTARPAPPPAPRPAAPPPRAQSAGALVGLVLGALALATLVIVGVWLAFLRKPVPAPSTASGAAPASPAAGDARTSLAVFDFDNATGDPSLDWLRTALTDMLLTDLSQSTKVRVVGTERVRQVLKELHHQDDRSLATDVVREVAHRTGVGTVILGSYVKGGETLRIQVKAQDAASGEILFAEHVEGPGQTRLFPMVAELTALLRTKLQVQATAAAPPDKDLDTFARRAAYALPVAAGQGQYKVGEALVVTVDVPRSGYLNLVNVGEGDAEATLLFPNRYHPQNKVEAGTRVTIPAPGDAFKLPAGLPAGMQRQQTLILAIHTQQPLNGYEMGLARAEAFSLLKGADTAAFFAAASSGGPFGAGKAVATISR